MNVSLHGQFGHVESKIMYFTFGTGSMKLVCKCQVILEGVCIFDEPKVLKFNEKK
jgi:hypothetical protein